MWSKGITNQKKAFVIEVHIKEDSKGIQTFRKLQDSIDENVVEHLPNNGLEHASFGLMQEAMRQEALFQALLLLAEGRDLNSDFLKEALNKTFSRMWDRLSDEIINLTIDSFSHESS